MRVGTRPGLRGLARCLGSAAAAAGAMPGSGGRGGGAAPRLGGAPAQEARLVAPPGAARAAGAAANGADGADGADGAEGHKQPGEGTGAMHDACSAIEASRSWELTLRRHCLKNGGRPCSCWGQSRAGCSCALS